MKRKRNHRGAGRTGSPAGHPPEPDLPPLPDEIAFVLTDAGWAVPTTPEQVAAAEADLSDALPALPDTLADPERVFRDRPPEKAVRVLPFAASADISAALARAAREGSRLDDDTLRRMADDRAAAEADRPSSDETPRP